MDNDDLTPRSLLACGLAALLLAALAACSDPAPAADPQPEPVENTCPALGTPVDPAGETAMLFDLTGAPIAGGANYFDLPYPLDLRLDADGKTDLSNFPNPGNNSVVRQIVRAARLHMEGWPADGQIFLRLTGPIEASSLPADPAAYRARDAATASGGSGRHFPPLTEQQAGGQVVIFHLWSRCSSSSLTC